MPVRISYKKGKYKVESNNPMMRDADIPYFNKRMNEIIREMEELGAEEIEYRDWHSHWMREGPISYKKR